MELNLRQSGSIFLSVHGNLSPPPPAPPPNSRSRIHERTISLRFLGIILIVLRLEVSLYNVYITNQFQPLFLGGSLWIARRKTLNTFVPITSKNSASGLFLQEFGAGKAQSAPYIMGPWSPSIIACGLTDCLLSGFQHEQFITFLFLINALPWTDGRLIMWHRRHIFQNNFPLYFTGAVRTTNALKI